MYKTLLFLLTILLTSNLSAQQHFTKSELEAQQAVVNMFEALSNRDSVGLTLACTNDITLYEYGQIWNLDTLIKKTITTNTSVDFKRANRFEFLSTTTDKNTAALTYRLYSNITKDGQQVSVEWLETVVLTREQNRWKVKHLHSTLIKRG